MIKYLPLLLTLTMSAQTKAKVDQPVPPKTPLAPAPTAPAVSQPTPPPALTELEQTTLQLEVTQNMLLRTQEQELQAKHQATILKINAAHPGFAYNEQTGQLAPISVPPITPKEEKK